MAFNYTLEPSTSGKVMLSTTAGDIEVELWPKQAPLACRNFVQLCLEGYYDNCLFHRVIKDFMIQTGDPTDSGDGGESAFGAPFKNEIHSRLRFTHRGILAMACDEEAKNSSQFFISLGPCEWLNGKNTIFAKVTGDTIFNVAKVAECETDENDRPMHSLHRILKTDVIFNPFDDIVVREKKPLLPKKNKKKRKKKTDTRLLSFADDGDIVEDFAKVPKMASSHELLASDPALVPDDVVAQPPKAPSHAREPLLAGAGNETSTEAPKELCSAPEQPQQDSATSREAIRSEYALLKKEALEERTKGVVASKESILTPLEQRSVHYRKRKSTKKQREEETLRKLSSFSRLVKDVSTHPVDNDKDDEATDASGPAWMASTLQFAKRPQDFDPMARDTSAYEYSTYDPRRR